MKSQRAGDKYFNGAMDEIKIYKEILAAEDIKAEYDKYASSLTAAAAYYVRR